MKELPKIGIRAIAVFIPALIISLIFKKRRSVSQRNFWETVFCLCIIGFVALILIANLLGRKTGPHALNTRYILMFFFGYIFFGEKQKRDELYYYFYYPCIFLYCIVVLSSFLGFEVSASYLIPGLIAVVIELYETSSLPKLSYYAIMVFVLSIIAYKGFFVIADGTGPSTILDKRVMITASSQKGLYTFPEEADRYMNDFSSIQSNTGKDETIAILTDDPNMLFFVPGRVSTCKISCYTMGYGKEWVDYYSLFKHKIPDQIIIDRHQITDVDEFLNTNEFGKWIAKNYDVANRKTDRNLIYLRLL